MIAQILCLSVVYAIFGWWKSNTAAGRGFEHYVQNWKTDWVTGLGISVVVALSPMVLVVVLFRLGVLP